MWGSNESSTRPVELLDIPEEMCPPRPRTNSPCSERRTARSAVAQVIAQPSVAFSVSALDQLSRKAHVVSISSNLALFCGKLFVYLQSGSIAILASLVDSTIDLIGQGILLWANRASQQRGEASETAYPAGRARLEPMAVVVCALLMAGGALLVMQNAASELIAFAVRGTTRMIEVTVLDVSLMCGTVLAKIGLYVWCSAVAARTQNVTVSAVAQDNLNDVLSNSLALAAYGATQIRSSFWLSDPLGAVLISLYIIVSWTRTGLEQLQMIVGKTADAPFLDVVREMAETHDPLATLDVVRAYHFGPKFLVEIELVMPPDTTLRDSHDLGIRLQHKIEALDAVERCFVHIDYQLRDVDDHDPTVPLEYKTADAHTLPRPSPDVRNRMRQVSFGSATVEPAELLPAPQAARVSSV